MGGFKASLDLLSVIFEEKQLTQDIKTLEKKSLVSLEDSMTNIEFGKEAILILSALSHEMASSKTLS